MTTYRFDIDCLQGLKKPSSESLAWVGQYRELAELCCQEEAGALKEYCIGFETIEGLTGGAFYTTRKHSEHLDKGGGMTS